MSINGIKENDSFFKRRVSNSLERNNYYYLPKEKAKNRTIEYEDKDYFKPRIRKTRITKDLQNNNDYRFRNTNNDFNNYNRTYSSLNINNNKPHNIIPRIVRNKNKLNKYINKTTAFRDKEEQYNNYNQINNNINKYKRPKSIESYDYKYNPYESYKNNMIYNYNMNKEDLDNQKKYKKINRNASFDSKEFINKQITNLLCQNCFDKKMLEEESQKNKEIDKIGYLNDKFMNVNPFYFIDQMNDNEKKRIKDKVDSNSYKQRLALENFKKEIEDPKNNSKENLQLINEYSLNPLSIEVGKDPRYLKQKKNYDKKEKIIEQNPDKYKSLGLRKAYNDYYNKCMYQIPKLEEMYHVNSVYKDNYIKSLKKQIEDKKNKEYEDKKKQKDAEALANKTFNEYKRKAFLNDKEKQNYGIELLINDNKGLDDFKSYKNSLLREKEKKLQNERIKKNNKIDNDINLRNKNEKSNIIKNYHNWLEDMDKKNQAKKEIKDEENKKWNNFIKNYNVNCNCAYANCDICNRPYQKAKLKRFPPSSSYNLDFGIN